SLEGRRLRAPEHGGAPRRGARRAPRAGLARRTLVGSLVSSLVDTAWSAASGDLRPGARMGLGTLAARVRARRGAMGFWDWFTGRPSSPESYRAALLPALQRAHPTLGFGPGETAFEVAGRRPDGVQVLVSLRAFYSRLERGADSFEESERRV